MLKFSKKLIAVTTAVALAIVGFAAAPASAESLDTVVAKKSNLNATRTIDPTTHQVTFYAGETMNLFMNFNVKSGSLAALNSTVVLNSGLTVISGSLPSVVRYSISLMAYQGSTPNSYMNSANSTTLTQAISYVPGSANGSIGVFGTMTSDVTLAFDPSVTAGGTRLTTADFNQGTPTAMSVAIGTYLSRPGDTALSVNTQQTCVDTSGLTNGNSLGAEAVINDGSTPASQSMSNAFWYVSATSMGMPSSLPGNPTLTYNPTSIAAGERLLSYMNVTLTSVTPGHTYTIASVKVFKTTAAGTNLVTPCAAPAVTGVLATSGSTVTATLDPSADAVGSGYKYNPYNCYLYATSDTNHTTVVATATASVRSWGVTNTHPDCVFSSVPAGTYEVAVQGQGGSMSNYGITAETTLAGTATVSGTSSTPTPPTVTPTPPTVQKTAPTAPTLGAKVKKGKTLSLKLHASAGTKTVAKNANGLVTTVALAAGAKSYCSITKVLTKNKITGYTVKGLKASATRCQVVVTITGNTTYDSLTRTYTVNVTK